MVQRLNAVLLTHPVLHVAQAGMTFPGVRGKHQGDGWDTPPGRTPAELPVDNAEGFNVEGRHLARQPHAAFHRMDVFRRDSGTPTAPEVRGIEFAKLSTGESPGPNLKPPSPA